MDKKKLKTIEVEQNKLFKKLGFTYHLTIGFPQQKVPLIGRFALWILSKVGAKLNLQVVEVSK